MEKQGRPTVPAGEIKQLAAGPHHWRHGNHKTISEGTRSRGTT